MTLSDQALAVIDRGAVSIARDGGDAPRRTSNRGGARFAPARRRWTRLARDLRHRHQPPGEDPRPLAAGRARGAVGSRTGTRGSWGAGFILIYSLQFKAVDHTAGNDGSPRQAGDPRHGEALLYDIPISRGVDGDDDAHDPLSSGDGA